MSIVTVVVFSILLLTLTGCVTAGDPSAAKQETGKKDFSSFSGEGPGFESQPAHHSQSITSERCCSRNTAQNRPVC
jgi:hypothetical protein